MTYNSENRTNITSWFKQQTVDTRANCKRCDVIRQLRVQELPGVIALNDDDISG